MKPRRIARLFCTFFISGILIAPSAPAAIELSGSGASFPYQIYSIWFMLFGRENKDVHITYTPKGSGGGIRDFQNHVVDFAASDAAMSDEEIHKVGEEVQLLPMTAGEVVLAYNLPGVAELRLPRCVYPDIFLGKITRWNDPAITSANPDSKLPDLEITVITRRDSSGTTFVFTRHLSAISETFASGPGFGKKVAWPTELHMVSSAINAGISSSVSTIPGAIGYIDYGFASLAGLQMATLENKAGNFIAPGHQAGMAALASQEMPENMIAWLSDPLGPDSYPITTYTWMMFYRQYHSPEKAAAINQMIGYFLDVGQQLSARYGYIPLPRKVTDQVRTAAATIGATNKNLTPPQP